MAKINTYLTFNGNCREAMTFYKDCLGGELILQTIGDSPLADTMPKDMKEYILHSTLVADALVLMASDMVPESGLMKGNAVSLMLECGDEAEIRLNYERLSAGGQRTHELEYTFYGAIMGDFTDQFGNHWLLHYFKNIK